MICYAECFNTLINIFKVFHEPHLKALLPSIERSAAQKGQLRPGPPKSGAELQGWGAEEEPAPPKICCFQSPLNGLCLFAPQIQNEVE